MPWSPPWSFSRRLFAEYSKAKALRELRKQEDRELANRGGDLATADRNNERPRMLDGKLELLVAYLEAVAFRLAVSAASEERLTQPDSHS